MSDEPSGPSDLADSEIPFSSLLARTSSDPLSPPLSPVTLLPCGELSPPVFERLVAETVWLVDGLNGIRVYGRSGQDQGGLDLVGRKGSELHVYQVRRIVALTPAGLRDAVTDFADPVQLGRSQDGAPRRRFDARRFVLVTACVVDDRNVDDELIRLQQAYAGDLEIDLYDGQQISRALRERGSLVNGIFGPDWAKAFCGSTAVSNPTTPDGRILLNDPIEMLRLESLRDEANSLDAEDPARAAELFAQMSEQLSAASLQEYSRIWKARERDAKRASGDNWGAFNTAMELLLNLYDSGRHVQSESSQITVLAESIGTPAVDAARIANALADWPEYGYDLGPISEALHSIVSANYALSGRLAVAVAEQIVTDDDPDDDFVALVQISEQLVGGLPLELRIRLECCIADLNIYAGVDPNLAFASLIGRANAGYLSETIGALVLRRAGRALAFSGDPESAINVYRRSVIDSASSDHGGDARDALRSINYLADTWAISRDTTLSARSVPTRTRLLPGSDNAALEALEALVDSDLPEANRTAHHWVRYERTNGSLADEIVARRRYGMVLDRAGEARRAIHQFVLAGARKAAVEVASSATAHFDLSRYLTTRFPAWVHETGAAVSAAQADLIPDDQVFPTCMDLTRIVESAGAPVNMLGHQPAKYALGALAAFERRIPPELANQLLPRVVQLIPREPNRHRFSDTEMLQFLTSCVLLDQENISTPAAQGLAQCINLQIDRADRFVTRLGPKNNQLLTGMENAAREGSELAIRILSTWDRVIGNELTRAQDACERLLSHPVGRTRQSWQMGNGATYDALLLHVALSPDARGNRSTDLIGLRNRTVAHLLAWAEDGKDIASSRTGAISALNALVDRLPKEIKRKACRRLIALHDNPSLHPGDLRDQESLHPLSRWRFKTGSEYLPAESLLAAAYYAVDRKQAEHIRARLDPALASIVADDYDGMLRGKTLVAINEIDQSFPIDHLIAHPAKGVRQAIVVCWTRRKRRDVKLAAIFAKDPNKVVRANLATYLSKLESVGEIRNLADVLTSLREDQSFTVRYLSKIPRDS